MTEIPETWPPDDLQRPERIVPLFPLPDVWLFPRTLMPLHVFEPRYRQMIEDCLDGPGRIVLGTVLPGHEDELAGAPPIHPIAGIGEIVHHRRLPDGRFDIHLFGLGRVSVREVESERLYRKVAVEPMVEVEVARKETEPLRTRLREAIQARADKPREIPDDAPVGMLIDMLLLDLDLPNERRQDLFAEPHPVRRAREALREHERH